MLVFQLLSYLIRCFYSTADVYNLSKLGF